MNNYDAMLLNQEKDIKFIIESKTKEAASLMELQEWFFGLEKQQRPFIGKQELYKIAQVKLGFSKSFRPGFLSKIKDCESKGSKLNEQLQASLELLDHLDTEANLEFKIDTIVKAILCLNQLYGVGFATSTFVLSRFSEHIPLMADETLLLALGTNDTKAIKYNKRDFITLFKYLSALLDKFDLKDWNIRKLNQAIWISERAKNITLKQRTQWDKLDRKEKHVTTNEKDTNKRPRLSK